MMLFHRSSANSTLKAVIPAKPPLCGKKQIQESQEMKADRRRAVGSSGEALSLIQSAARLVSDIPVSRSMDKQEKSHPSEDLSPLSKNIIRYTGRRDQVFHLGRYHFRIDSGSCCDRARQRASRDVLRSETSAVAEWVVQL
jgi:hypothetical protein